MSFKCEACGTQQKNGSKPRVIVTEYKEIIYPVRFSDDGKRVIDKGGKGKGIVKERRICDLCFLEYGRLNAF
jgi:hypothetical protein